MELNTALAIRAERNLTDDEFDSLCLSFGHAGADPLDAISIAVARLYMQDHVTYEVADAFMNSLWPYALNVAERLPPLTLCIYDAFDSGEYRHVGDPEGTDPELKYTRPALARVLDTNTA